MELEQFLHEILKNNQNVNIEEITKAFNACKYFHKKQYRKSGEPYSNHPIEVAIEVSKLGMDDTSIIVALLHDVLEDTNCTKEKMTAMFNDEITDLVDGVTKLEKIKLQEHNIRQVENFRKLFLAIAKDVRVLIVKLCDRLHNMRTIDGHNDKQKQIAICIETIEIYAPLAERIGLQSIKNEIQDICFKILKPDLYAQIVENINKIEEDYKTSNVIDDVVQELKSLMIQNNISAKILGRKKQPYSVYLKTKRHNLAIDDLADIIAFRILVSIPSECYIVLGAVHLKYHAVPNRFDDYISTPKINNYQSLHTTIMGPKNHLVEIQIRTEKMHNEAEYGMASHWRYKQSTGKNHEFTKIKAAWVDRVLRILDQTKDLRHVLESAKLEIQEDNIFVFNIDGNMIDLPKNSMILDFVFYVDEKRGKYFHYAKVNGEKVDFHCKLKNGEKVEIIYNTTPTIQPEWINHVITGQARNAILRQY